MQQERPSLLSERNRDSHVRQPFGGERRNTDDAGMKYSGQKDLKAKTCSPLPHMSQDRLLMCSHKTGKAMQTLCLSFMNVLHI